MNRHLKIVGAVLKKDILLLWPLVVLNVAVYGAQLGIVRAYSKGAGGRLIETLMQIGPFAAVLSSAFLLFSLAHQDPAPGVRQDWVTRPIPRLDLVLAKLLFIVLLMVVPASVAFSVNALLEGHSVAELAAGLPSNALLLLLLPAALAFVALTSNLLEGLAVAFAMFLLLVATPILSSLLQAAAVRGVAASGFNWQPSLALELLVIGLGFVGLWVVYGLRRITLARILAVASAVFLACLTLGYPWSAALAVQSAVSPGKPPGSLAILSSPDCVTFNAPAADMDLLVSGAPGGWKVMVDQIVHRKLGEPEIVTPGLRAGAERQSSGLLRIPVAFVPDWDRQGRFAAGDFTAIMSLLEPEPAVTLTLDGQRRRIPGFGWCGMEDEAPRPRLNCSLDQAAYVEAELGGERVPCRNCGRTYAPFGRGGSATWPLPPQATAGEQIVLRPYRHHSTAVKRVVVPAEALAHPAKRCFRPKLR